MWDDADEDFHLFSPPPWRGKATHEIYAVPLPDGHSPPILRAREWSFFRFLLSPVDAVRHVCP